MTKYNTTYWCSWGGNEAYPDTVGGKFITKAIDLAQIPEFYNTIIIAFIIGADDHVTPILSNDIDINKIKTAQSKNQKVLISIGGANAHLNIKTEEEAKIFEKGLIDIIEKYNFDGLDIDIEKHSMGSDAKLFGEAVLAVTKYFREKNEDFMLTAAPEFLYLDAEYPKWYFELFETIDMENMTVIWPQFYNQGTANGPNINPNGWEKITPANGMDIFLASCAWAFTTDIGHTANPNYMKIPKEKFALGIPASNGASGDPIYVTTPAQIEETYSLIKDKYDTSIVGFMNWCADFDAYTQNVGDPKYNHQEWETGKAIADVLGI